MAYLLGIILYCVVSVLLIIIHPGIGLGWLIFGLIGRFEGWGSFGAAPIADVLPRLIAYFQDGEPLIPNGFPNSRIFGFWFGMACVFLGHAGLLVYLFFLFALQGTPYTQTVPLAIGLLPILAAWGIGISMVESSYDLWAERIAEPYKRYERKQREKSMPGSGDSETPWEKALLWVAPFVGAILILGLQILFEKRIDSQRGRENATSWALHYAGPSMTFIENHWREQGKLLCPGDPELESMRIPRVRFDQRWVELTGCGELYVRIFNRDGFVDQRIVLQAIDLGENELGWGCASSTLKEMSREAGQRCRFAEDARPGESYVTEATLVRSEQELEYLPGGGTITYGESRARARPGDFLALEGKGWNGAFGYYDYDTGRWLEVAALLDVEVVSNDQIRFAYSFPDEPERDNLRTLRLEEGGTRLNGLEVAKRSVKPETILQIVAAGEGTDEDRRVPVRMTYLISRTKLTITKEIIQPTGSRFKRHEYHFERPEGALD